ncbi:prepilin-type N-terminal cleavage/methylation domain-containing protein [Natranaerobius thermophilus]|uniref:Prepilin-type N-terminal cleavage/methylation domain-containing protein n=1 Tax=Natranaerobius thermophilus (strain ATCC BAA-1301 / DSM 18059 / JW/NM-WN-LF) TaxID=457570 RepID=B2A187_NATTJ|nr:prepilin-type N-terminal cleavage/methylation domain-containing protein [Natranaerobius thermophilus]ACB86028.1 hypothetical protein Nther_2463 [Natranaerobius thermophilus JW/NM-WN-LF]
MIFIKKLHNKVSRLFKDKNGFTLIELIAVIGIIGILIALVAPNVMSYIGEAEKEACRAEKQQLENAIKTAIYLEDKGEIDEFDDFSKYIDVDDEDDLRLPDCDEVDWDLDDVNDVEVTWEPGNND